MRSRTYLLVFAVLFFGSYTNQIHAQEFWGLTTNGGVNNTGIIFEWGVGSSGFFNTNFEFGDTSSGASHPGRSPEGSLILASNDNLYGMTLRGGLNNAGTLFEYNPATFTFTKKIDFDNTTNGKFPTGSLTQATGGIIYGMTKQGGAGDAGVFFQFNPSTGSYLNLVHLDWVEVRKGV